MKKQKAVMQISALKGENNKFSLELLTGNAAVFNLIRPVVEKCNKSYGGYIQIEKYAVCCQGLRKVNGLLWICTLSMTNCTRNTSAKKRGAVKNGYTEQCR